ncbi:MAG: hypothetical protein V2A76_06870 [Planctomycetota bacterium]
MTSHLRSALMTAILALFLAGNVPAGPPDPCGGAHTHLSALETKQLDKLETKLARTLSDLARYRQKLAAQEARLAAGEQELEEALAMPEDTAQQRRQREAAIKAAKKQIRKATKGLEKWGGKVASRERKRDNWCVKLEGLDPWRFSGPGPGPAGNPAYEPAWAGVAPSRILELETDPLLSDDQNGARLKGAILALIPGDRLEIGGGVWSINSYFNVTLQGTALAPIQVVARDGEFPVITRPDAGQNLMNVGNMTPASSRYILFRGLTFTGGSAGVRLYGAANVWIDRCEIHHTGEAGMTTNTVDTDSIYITRNHIHHTGGYGEGMYLGANSGAVVMSNSVVARNHVHDTGGTQGDGIELKQGSYGNWLVANCVHDTNYPCILVYGTHGNPVNIVERNHCVGSNDNVMQVQGEAIVINNLVVGGANAFFSTDHQDSSVNLSVVHNTFVSQGIAAYLSSWNGRQGMLFANNVTYSEGNVAVSFSGGSSGVSATGNMTFGGVVHGPPAGFSQGGGLGDFRGLSWDGARVDSTPIQGEALIGSGDPVYGAQIDLSGSQRTGSLESGCSDSE